MWNSHLELSISVAGRPASPGVLDVLKIKFLKIRKLDDYCLTPLFLGEAEVQRACGLVDLQADKPGGYSCSNQASQIQTLKAKV